MKSWWLKLYTLPSLKEMILPMSVWCLANVLNAFFFPQIRELSLLVAPYPIYVFIFNLKNTFGSNVEFHQNHIPFKSLRKNLFLDLIIQIFCFVTLFLLSSFVPWFGKNTSMSLIDLMGTRTLFFMWSFLLFVMLIIIKLGVVKVIEEGERKKNKLKVDYSFLVLFFLVFFYGAKIDFNFSVPVLIYFIFIVLGVDTIFKWYSNVFHTNFWYFKGRYFFVFLVAGISFITIKSLSNAAKIEVLDSRYSVRQRLETFIFFKNFDFILNEKTLRDFFNADFSESDLAHVLAGASSDVFHWDVDYLITEPDFKLYKVYLSSNRVTKKNIKKIYEKYQNSNSKWGSSSYYYSFKYKLAHLYPEGQLHLRGPANIRSFK